MTLTDGSFLQTNAGYGFNVNGTPTVGPGATLGTGYINGGTGASTIYFNGGTVAPNVGNGYGYGGLAAEYVSAGGLTVDTTNAAGNPTVSFNDVLQHDPAAGGTDGGLTKAGNGSLVLSGVNTYAGPTNVSAGTVEVTAAGQIAGALAVGGGGTVAVVARATGRTVLSVASIALDPAATFDLGGNDLVVRNGSLAAVTAAVAAGSAGGATGGLVSSAAAANTSRLTMLGVIQNGVDGTTTGTPLTARSTRPRLGDRRPGQVHLLRRRQPGRQGRRGRLRPDRRRVPQPVDGSPLTGWYNGDFNYDGKVDASDYTLIDNAFNNQQGRLATAALPAAAVPAAAVPAAALPAAALPAAAVAGATDEVAPAPGGAAVPEPAAGVAVAASAVLSRHRRRP